MPATSTSHKTAWLVGSYNTTSSDCLSRPRNDSFFLFLPNSGWPHHPLTGVSVFPPAVAGDTLAPSRSPYWPGVPVTLLLWVLTAESSKLVPFYETRLTGADRAATANTDGYETPSLSRKGQLCGGVYDPEPSLCIRPRLCMTRATYPCLVLSFRLSWFALSLTSSS